MVYENVKDIARLFKSGEPVSTEVNIREDSIVLLFDNGYEDDVNASYVITTLSVEREKFDYDTTNGNTLEDIIPSLSDVGYEIIESFEEAGLDADDYFQYDESNSNEKYLDFVLTIYP
jgi:hypothetical protein